MQQAGAIPSHWHVSNLDRLCTPPCEHDAAAPPPPPRKARDANFFAPHPAPKADAAATAQARPLRSPSPGLSLPAPAAMMALWQEPLPTHNDRTGTPFEAGAAPAAFFPYEPAESFDMLPAWPAARPKPAAEPAPAHPAKPPLRGLPRSAKAKNAPTQQARGRPRQDEQLTYAKFAAHFHKPSEQAADDLGMGLSRLKRACRKVGIMRWPYRFLTSATGRVRLAAPSELQLEIDRLSIAEVGFKYGFFKASRKSLKQCHDTAKHLTQNLRNQGVCLWPKATQQAALGAYQRNNPCGYRGDFGECAPFEVNSIGYLLRAG